MNSLGITNLNTLSVSCLAVGIVLASAVAAVAQPKGFNYDESRVPKYTLPDPLVMADGAAVSDAQAWRTARRAEIIELFREHVFGRSPDPPPDISFEVVEREAEALDGLATRRQVRVHFSRAGADGPGLDLLLYLPRRATGPVPAFLGINFHGNHTIHADAGIRLPGSWVPNNKKHGVENNRASEKSRGVSGSRWPIETIIEHGYALAAYYYGDVDPDFDDGFKNGVHPLFDKPAASRPPDAWGSIAAWAWGFSRALDYLQTDAQIDARRVAVIGHSRLGKTALWAGAADERFAMVVSNNSGCGGAALSRRRYGETVQRINGSFPHWFCGNFKKYNDQEDELPVDQHMLVALIAPRPVYIASAEQDRWADPRGEFLSARHADPVYRLLGTKGLPVKEMPAVDRPAQGRIGYHIRSGGHDVTDYDWQQYLKFADTHLGKP